MQQRAFQRGWRGRWTAGAALAAALCAGAGAAGVPPEPPARPIEDPHHGDHLFYFFQGRYFSSVTKLMVSQHFERVPHHADEAEVLRGGLLASYGLHREAGEVFDTLIARGAATSVRDRAWYFLAKIRYQRGALAEAFDALQRVENPLPAPIEEDRVLLQANLLMARADFAGAAAALQGLAANSLAGPYARYNLGVALVRSGDTAGGSALLDTLGRAPAPTEEIRSLRDKANVALGYAALRDERPEDGRKSLERVRLASLQANKALLGFGWAAASMKQPKLALVPWIELAQRDASDAAVLEAKIAVPYAYAELGAFGQSLDRYNEAIAAFEAENRRLDESIAAIRAGKLVEGLIERNPGEEMGWFWNLRELPEMPHASHLTSVLAEHPFQEAFKNYRDLRFLADNLAQWQDKLGAFGDMLDTRRAAFAERLPRIREQSRDTGLEALQRRRDGLASELATAQERADGEAFADARETELKARIDSVRATLNVASNDPELASVPERLRLASGALSWQLSQAYPLREWEARKALDATDKALAEARVRDASLAQAQRDEPARFDAFGARIAALGPRLQALVPRVAAVTAEQQAQVQELAVAELQRQKDRLGVYATQARFAVAQLYDRATLAQEPARASDHAKPR